MSENEQVNQKIVLKKDEIQTKEILILQRAYPLDEHNFNKLLKKSSGCKDWAQKFLFLSIGWGIKILSAFIVFLTAYHTAQVKNNIVLDIKDWELYSIVIGIVIWLILFFVGKYVKDEKDILIEKINSFYRNN